MFGWCSQQGSTQCLFEAKFFWDPLFPLLGGATEMSGAAYLYDWLRRRRKEQLKRRAKEIEKKTEKAMKYHHSHSKARKPGKNTKTR
jgi:hypothetical protein